MYIGRLLPPLTLPPLLFAMQVTVSFLEVYNESIRDLLSDVEEFLDLREDPIKGPIVAGITEVRHY